MTNSLQPHLGPVIAFLQRKSSWSCDFGTPVDNGLPAGREMTVTSRRHLARSDQTIAGHHSVLLTPYQILTVGGKLRSHFPAQVRLFPPTNHTKTTREHSRVRPCRFSLTVRPKPSTFLCRRDRFNKTCTVLYVLLLHFFNEWLYPVV